MKKTKKYCLILIAAVWLAVLAGEASAHPALRINEVLYDPEGNDNNREFIEIFSEEPMNVSGWIIADSEANDTLVEIRRHNADEEGNAQKNETGYYRDYGEYSDYGDYRDYGDHGYYALIVEEGFNHTGINASIYSAGATIGNNLNNQHDEIRMYTPNGTLAAFLNYSRSADRTSGTSLEYFNETYAESNIPGGTPGKKNSRAENKTENETEEIKVIDETIANETITAANETTTATNETITAANETTTVQTMLNETNENETEQEVREFEAGEEEKEEKEKDCEQVLMIETSTELVRTTEQLRYSFTPIPDATYTYRIEDLDGNRIRKERTTASPGSKSFTPRISEKEKIFRITAEAATEHCFFSAEKIIAVTNPSALPAEKKKRNEPAKKQNTPKNSPHLPQKKQENRMPQQIRYTLSPIPEKLTLVNNTAQLAFFLDIANNDEPRQFEVWSYLFRGPKSYSGEREKNRQFRAVDAGRTVRIPLVNTLNATPGNYVLRVRIRKDDQTTTADLTRTLLLEAEEKKEAAVRTVSQEVRRLVSPPASPQASPPAPPAAPAALDAAGARIIRRQPPTPYILAGAFFVIALGMIWVRI